MRETTVIEDTQTLRAHEHWLNKLRAESRFVSNGFVHVFPNLLAFCGKAYVWYETERTATPSDFMRFDDHDSLMGFVGRSKWKYWKREQDESKAEWKRLQLQGAIEINHLHSSPIVLITKTKIARYSFGERLGSTVSVTIDPCLKELGFSRFMTADQCHQEIEMFVGGVLANPEKGSNAMTDKEKILAHGMDMRWSFRNPEPPKRKRK